MSRSPLKLQALAACVLLAFASGASAALYTNVPNGANTGLPFASFGNAANPSGDSPKVGEVFSLVSDSLLSSFSFYALGNTLASFQLNVAQWNPNNTAGATLFTSGSATNLYDAAGGVTTLLFNKLGLNLDGGAKYIAYLSSNDPNVTGIQLSRTQTFQDASGFGVGNAYYSTIPGQGWQFPFNGFLSLQYTAVTTAVPEPASAALFIAGLGLIGTLSRRRNNLV
ncbi:MAG: PEP-CTERM sorting domain-containing protein [Rhodocyclaceae bacterium]|nr:PEP-CTERM sorting domain-containing protein [Rhodocyclaceae bacterium]